MVFNPYLDPATRQQGRELFMKALTPQIREGEDRVFSQVSPFMRGKRGASLLRQVYQPAQQQLAQYELGQQGLGTQFAAQSPFMAAPLTGQFEGQPTQQAQQQQFGQQLATAGMTGQYQGQPTLQSQLTSEQIRSSQAKDQLATQMFERSYEQLTPYQKAVVDSANVKKQLESLQSIVDVFGGVGGMGALAQATLGGVGSLFSGEMDFGDLESWYNKTFGG